MQAVLPNGVPNQPSYILSNKDGLTMDGWFLYREC